MAILTSLYNLLEVLIVLVPILLAVAFMTIIERKVLAAMQRRVGPNKVGYYGVLQPLNKWAALSRKRWMRTELYAGKYYEDCTNSDNQFFSYV